MVIVSSISTVAAIIGGEYGWLWWRLRVAGMRENPVSWALSLLVGTWERIGVTTLWCVVLSGLLLVEWRGCKARVFVPHAHMPNRRAYEQRDSAGRSSTNRSRANLAEQLPLTLRQTNLIHRKLFHAAAVAMFVPPVVNGLHTLLPLALGLAVVAKVLALLELGVALRLPPSRAFSNARAAWNRFTDERDTGVFVMTHIYLLLGCAVPVWLAIGNCVTHAELSNSTENDSPGVLLFTLAQSLAGILALGVGDAAAAIVGIIAGAAGLAHTWKSTVAAVCSIAVQVQRPVAVLRKTDAADTDTSRQPAHFLAGFGVHGTSHPQWAGATKTVEGTVAFAVSTVATLAIAEWLRGFSRETTTYPSQQQSSDASPFHTASGAPMSAWLVIVFITTAVAFIETFASTVDNLLLPAVYWAGLTAAKLAWTY